MISDENSLYAMTSFAPFDTRHRSGRLGRFLKETLTDRDIRPTIAASGIGMLSFYSELPLVDLHGLTDRVTARLPLYKRGYPGHEKFARRAHLQRSRVRLVQSDRLCPYDQYHAVRALQFEGEPTPDWCVFSYDRTLMHLIAERSPEIGFVDFPKWLDAYLRRVHNLSAEQRLDDLNFFKDYYFAHNSDPRRLRALGALP